MIEYYNFETMFSKFCLSIAQWRENKTFTDFSAEKKPRNLVRIKNVFSWYFYVPLITNIYLPFQVFSQIVIFTSFTLFSN